MPNYEVGSLLKKLRKQKGLSQEELAFPIIDRATLSKIESGKTLPHRKTLEFLFDKLGFDADEYLRHFLTTEEAETKRLQSELHYILRIGMRSDTERYKKECSSKVLELISCLESDEEYVSHPLNLQFLLMARAFHSFNLYEDEKALAYIKQGLGITIVDFNESDIANYYLTRHDRNLLIRLAGLYSGMKRYDEAINIYHKLKENTDIMCVDIKLHARRVSVVMYNLADTCMEAERHPETLEACEEGIKACYAAGDFFVFKELHWLKAQALLHLGEKEEFLLLAEKLYYAFDLHEDARSKKYVETIKRCIDDIK